MSNSYHSGKSSCWTWEENKKFECALVEFCESEPYRWEKIASMIRGKSSMDVEKHYNDLVNDLADIEAGLIDVPEYAEDHEYVSKGNGKGKFVNKSTQKSPRWEEEEHRKFLDGLNAGCKGDWKKISEKYVRTKTPAQVASHAQKYFLHQAKDKTNRKRSSIFDTTTTEN